MNARVYLILYTIILLKKFDLFIPTTGAAGECDDCFDWQYCQQEDATCVDCSRCGNGQGATTLCSQFSDTVCKPCPNGMFSALSVEHYAYLCFTCTKCGPDRDTIANCTAETDTSCGPCPRRMFAYDNGTCLECSQCPDDPSIQAIRYTECAVNGAPRNYMCLPGICTDCGEHNVTVNNSDGGWVTYKPDDIFFDGETEPTTESTTLPAAMSITVGTIVGLLVIFVGAFGVWLLYGMYCKRARRGQQQRQSDDDESESAVHLMDAEETTGEGTSSPTLVLTGSAATVQYVVQKPVPSLKLLEIIGFIKEVEQKWSLVAEALGMTKHAITEIDCTCNSKTTECCRKMLDKSLRSADSVSWSNIIKVCKKNYLLSMAMKLELFFTSDEMFCESDVVLWDRFVNQIKRESQKLFIIPKWCSQFNSALLQLDVIVQGQACTLEDAIIKLTDERCPQPIALVGEAGTGKTTMALQLVQNWCVIGSNSRFTLVIYINMTRTDVDKIRDLPSLISLHLETAVDTEMVGSMCKILRRQQGRGLLIILDGYDEVVQDSMSDIFIEKSLHSSLPKASLLFVRRPGYVTNVDYSIEVPLLRCDQIECYVQGTVGRRGIALRSTPIWPMMHNPLLLAIACQLVCHNIDDTSLSTLTQLYHTLVIKLISDQVRVVSYSDRDHSAMVRSILSSCAKASYEAMLQSQHFVTGVDNVDSLVKSGLLVKHHNTLYFTHRNFLEFFAAYHLAHSSSDFDPRALNITPSDTMLFPFMSGLTGKITYRTAKTNKNSLVVASVCYSEAKSPVNGLQHSAIDRSLTLSPLVLNNHVITPHQLQSLTAFMQECEGVKELTLNGFTSNKQLNTLTTTSAATSDDVICNQGEILAIFNSKYLKRINAANINVTSTEWLAVADAIKMNTSITILDLSYNTSIANDDIITGIATSLTINYHLETLSLSYCELTSSYADKLIKSLSSNICLLQIDLSNNLIEQLNIKMITEVLQHAIIQEINITNNPIAKEVQSKLVEIAHQYQKILL